MPRNLILTLAALLCAGALEVRAADTLQKMEAAPAGALAADSASTAAGDSTANAKPMLLLPDQLGPIESVMWSDHGFMRHFDYPLTEDGREKELKLRRTLLTVHEIAGFTTLAAMIATCIVGQMAYNEYPNAISPGLGNLKQNLAGTTEFLYFGTAALALFTPPPMVRRNEWSSVSTHKLLGAIHFTGMIITPILASQIGNTKRGNFSRSAETVHMIGGYTTTAAFAAAMMVIVF